MTLQSRISSIWNQPSAASGYLSGVSLHSHTNQSQESLTFLHMMGTEFRLLRPVFAHYERIAQEKYGLKLDFLAGHWTPPLTPRMAFDLEFQQIAEQTRLMPLISITDHDNINAPMLLRTIPSARHIPVSLEWSAPYGETEFHIGVHNLPSADAQDWMARFAAFTARAMSPKTASGDAELTSILEELNGLPNVLVVLNHPVWDLYQIGQAAHLQHVERFLAAHNHLVHALELNGLRHLRENREVAKLAKRWNQLVISGGDRHALEPNANINLSNAENFTAFVHEIRYEKKSHVLFMRQYAEPWQQRIVRSTVEAVSDFPSFPDGMRRWDERVFHPDANGVMRRASDLWRDGRTPRLFSAVINMVRMLHHPTMSLGLRLALSNPREMGAGFSEQEA